MKNIKFIKRIMMVLILVTFLLIVIPGKAASQVAVPKVNGGNVTFSDGSTVYISDTYKQKREMRAVWVSALTSDIAGFTSEEQYKQQIISVLETMEYYNMNTMLFHVRIMNDAFYESKYNSWSSYYSTNPTWDALPWIIEECHKRGIEFHAWMNPYRVTTGVSRTLEQIAADYKVSNAASDPKNLLKGSSCVILNPGEPDVRNFLVNTCMELAENYDIDAIHFDDYFYAAGIDDTETRQKYNNGLSVDDFRREQVNLFIEALHNRLVKLNNETGRCVQLGIAPTGVYKNGNGVVSYDSNGNAITTGSATRGQTHYTGYLYADTVKWINEEWIDYILPQTYWAIEHYACPYADLVTWWDKVVKNKKVNFYASLGLYMKTNSSGGSWASSDLEGYHQTMIVNGLDNCYGLSVYNYLSLRSTLDNDASFKKMDELWSKPAIVPEIRTQKSVFLPKVENLSVVRNEAGNYLSWDILDGAKFYAIYRSEGNLKYSNDEVIDVIGNVTNDGRVEFTDINADAGKIYNYGIKALSSNNTLGDKASVSTENISEGGKQSIGKLTTFVLTDNVANGEKVTVRWNNHYFGFGDEIKYELTYSFDGGDKVTSTSFYKNRVQNCFDITIPDDAKKINVSLKMYNNIGETIQVIEKDIVGSLGKISHLGYEGKIYRGEETTFTWNSLGEGVTYKIQYSQNTYDWSDIYEVREDGETTGLNKVVSFKLPTDLRDGFLRVVGIKDGKYGYSDIIKIEVKSYLGKYAQLTINEEEVASSYLLEEGDKLVIKWRVHTADKKNADYSVMISNDLVNWRAVKTYSAKSELKKEGSYMIQTIPLTYSSLKIYIKIIGSSGTYANESDVFEVNVKVFDLYIGDVATYYKNEISANINDLDIYK